MRGRHTRHPRRNGKGGGRNRFPALRRLPAGESEGTDPADHDGTVGVCPPDVHPDGTDLRPYKRLAAAVIHQALLDAQHQRSDEARRWLSEESYALRFWCLWLGINPEWVRGAGKTGKRGRRGSRARGTVRALKSA